MVVYRRWIIQEMLEQGMDGGGAQKIRAPHHMGDVFALRHPPRLPDDKPHHRSGATIQHPQYYQ